MRIDWTLKVSKGMSEECFANESMSRIGHLGTHFGVMNKEFSLNNMIRKGKPN